MESGETAGGGLYEKGTVARTAECPHLALSERWDCDPALSGQVTDKGPIRREFRIVHRNH